MEERTTPQLKQWFVREWDNAFFYCETIEDKYVEGHGFINNKFDGLLYFDRLYFSKEFKETTYEFIEDYFNSNNKETMTKETIMNTYAIKQGYLNYEHLIDRIIDNNSLELARDLILEHQNAVSDLIQEELKKKCAEEGRLSRIKEEILNTEIL